MAVCVTARDFGAIVGGCATALFGRRAEVSAAEDETKIRATIF